MGNKNLATTIARQLDIFVAPSSSSPVRPQDTDVTMLVCDKLARGELPGLTGQVCDCFNKDDIPTDPGRFHDMKTWATDGNASYLHPDRCSADTTAQNVTSFTGVLYKYFTSTAAMATCLCLSCTHTRSLGVSAKRNATGKPIVSVT